MMCDMDGSRCRMKQHCILLHSLRLHYQAATFEISSVFIRVTGIFFTHPSCYPFFSLSMQVTLSAVDMLNDWWMEMSTVLFYMRMCIGSVARFRPLCLAVTLSCFGSFKTSSTLSLVSPLVVCLSCMFAYGTIQERQRFFCSLVLPSNSFVFKTYLPNISVCAQTVFDVCVV